MKLYDTVKVKDLKHLDFRWRGKSGKVVSIFGEIKPFFYEVPIEGFLLLFKGDELEVIKK